MSYLAVNPVRLWRELRKQEVFIPSLGQVDFSPLYIREVKSILNPGPILEDRETVFK